MSKCTFIHIAETAREHRGDASSTTSSLSFSASPERQKQREDSPLLRLLKEHFERYQGLTEPKINSLEPQTDDL